MVRKTIENTVEYFVFASRWIQAPIYLGLIIGSIMYCGKFIMELVAMYTNLVYGGATEGGVQPGSKEGLMLDILGLVDMSMVANLVYMVVVGGWTMFVSKIDMEGHEDRPDWLESTNANTLKIKLAASLVGVSGIHLLKTFIELGEEKIEVNTSHILWQVLIHLTFLASSIALAFTEWMLHASHTNGAEHKPHAPMTD
jgi:uncharacterized protein (TIGR00645 family)